MSVPVEQIESPKSCRCDIAPAATVVFTPYDAKNPYQAQIVKGLRDRGYKVLEYAFFWDAYTDIMSGKISPDILHLHWLYFLNLASPLGSALKKTAAFVKGLRKLRRCGVKTVWTVHNYRAHECRRPHVDKLMRIALGAIAGHVIVHSPQARELIHRSWLIGRSRISVVPHPHYIDVYRSGISREEAERTLGLTPTALRYVFLGTVRRYKQVPGLIKAFREFDQSDTQLLVAGKAANDQDLLDNIKSEIAGDHRVVLRLGFIDDDDIQKYMAAADVIVFPYSEVLTSGAVMLAVSFGRPCIAPEAGAFKSVLNERGAFFYDMRRPDGLACAMREAFANRSQLSAYGRYNRQRAELWAPAQISAQTGDVYRVLLTAN